MAPPPTWPVNPVTKFVIGSYQIGIDIPYGAITSATPTGCPNVNTDYPPLKIFALSPGTSGGINWGLCTSFQIGSALSDSGAGNVAWLILGVGTPIAPIYATTEAYGVALDPAGDVFVVGGSNTADLHPSLPGPAPSNGGIDWLGQADTHYPGTGAWIIKLLGRDTFPGCQERWLARLFDTLGINRRQTVLRW